MFRRTTSTLRHLFGATRTRPGAARPRARLACEALEGRLVPSAYYVTNGFDSGPGSLRAAVAGANADPSLDADIYFVGVAGVDLLSTVTLSTVNMRFHGVGPGEHTMITRDFFAEGAFSLIAIVPCNSPQVYEFTDVDFSGGVGVDGGAIYAPATLNLTDCVFTGNSAERGGAIYSTFFLTATGCIFAYNTATAGGGAIYHVSEASLVNLTFTDCGFMFNETTGGNGGCIYYQTALGTLRLTGTDMLGTADTGSGGAIFQVGGGLTVSGGVISGCMADHGAGAIEVADPTLLVSIDADVEMNMVGSPPPSDMNVLIINPSPVYGFYIGPAVASFTVLTYP
jgi:predicted outer membrane repeat protein